MAFLERKPDKQTRALVGRWFAKVNGATVFLPGDGRALLLDPDEARAIRSALERKAATINARIRLRALIVVPILAAAAVGIGLLLTRLPQAWSTIAYALLAGAMLIHGGLIYREVRLADQQWQLMRASVGHSLKGRVPSRELEARFAYSDKWRKILIAALAGSIALGVCAGALSHFGINLLSWLSPWISVVFVAACCFLGEYLRWKDKRSGRG